MNLSPTMAELCAAVKGRPLQGRLEAFFAGACIDTRIIEKGNVFFALAGSRTDGHRFVAAACAKGAAGAVVERSLAGIRLPRSFPVIRVARSTAALQKGAAWHRGRFHLPLVGITGSNGKTTAKEMTAWILRRLGGVVATRGNLNNHLGVPLTLFDLYPGAAAAVVEIGMNRPGEIRRLAALAAPNIGVLLNAGTAHMGFFRNRREVARAKAEIIEGLEAGNWAVLNADDPYVWSHRRRTRARVLGFGSRSGDVRAEAVRMDRLGCPSFRLVTPDGSARVRLRVLGGHNVGNAAAAAAVGWLMGLKTADLAASLSSWRFSLPMRMERRRINGATAIVDCYNANAESCLAAFSFLRSTGVRKPVLVLGEIRELGPHSEKTHRLVGAAAAKLDPGLLVGVGREARPLVEAARGAGVRKALWVGRAEDAAGPLSGVLKHGTVALFKASRGVHLECLVYRLKEGVKLAV